MQLNLEHPEFDYVLRGADGRQALVNDRRLTRSFIVAPRVANMFGTSAISAVNKAEGELVEGTMRGEDAGGEIQQLKSGDVERMRQLRELERRRDDTKPGSRERAQIEEEISGLNNARPESKIAQNNAQARLNWTPVNFTYESRSGLFGAGKSDGLAGSGAASLSAMLSLVAIAAPWLLLIGVIAWLWRRFGGVSAPVKAATENTNP